ncbi:PAS domain S-box protein [Mariprofundus erugo]|uniref:histidine kinase n=1 Tax=Mariprofundus erugo TaxID=2528639 RepID=A0A5R9H390_9PROT|nr:MHYT domain-containing protein [Mariprofundus erugo]TLS69124.1 PAS domain S-box protein [Mariprofundus erugo]
MELTAHFDIPLVALSIVTAMICSLVALETVPRINTATDRSSTQLWIIAFGLGLGTGIWSMHFIAMQAWHLPIPVHYDITLTVSSLLLAAAVSAIAITPLQGGEKLTWSRLLLMSVIMGTGIAGMHYSGMAAMRMNADMQYQPSIIIASIIIAIAVSAAALAIANRLRQTRIFGQAGIKITAAMLMGLAIASMHYTAMIGVRVTALPPGQATTIDAIAPGIMAGFIVIFALLIQAGIIVAALLDESNGRARASEARMKQRADINQALSAILATAIERLPLPETLDKTLDIMLSIDWLSFQQQGSIFLADHDERKLRMIAQRNLGKDLQSRCSVLNYGQCLCGKAAEEATIIFRDHIDADHHHTFDHMDNHGHYCTPILSDGIVLGVINLYVKAGHTPLPEEKEFLNAAADAISSIIRTRRIEQHSNLISAAIDQAGEVVMVTDQFGRIEYVNHAFSEITGYTAAEAIGQTPSILKSGNQDNGFYKQMWDTILAGEVWQGEVVERRKDGSYYPAMLTISPTRIGSDSITHFVGIHEDLSEHKKLESQFRQAQKMEALGTLVGGIAHEFNNMLAGMMGNVFLAKRHAREHPEMMQKLDRIETVGFQAADMIKQMLVFARSEEVEMDNLPLAPFLVETIKLHQLAIPENISLEQQLSREDFHVRGNPTQLQQVILNLFGNAVDAVQGKTSPNITIRLERISAGHAPQALTGRAGDYAHLSVEDNGHGIAPNHLEHIFDPFFTTKEPGKGTGLGLAMCSAIIKSHRGLIEVSSTEGQGTVFHVYLPLVEHINATDSTMKIDKQMQSNGEKILIVDDEPNLSIATAESLESIGFRVMTASNGKQALDICRVMRPDIVLLDVVMPVMNGPEAARAIRANYPDTRLIFSTGYDRGQLEGQTEGLESIPVLSKPFSIPLLYRTIREQLAGQQ